MIADTIKEYKDLGDYFSPEHECDNEVLDNFKKRNRSLTKDYVGELKLILDGSDKHAKFFVADLLYLYNDFDEALLEPMVTNAIRYKDPSFNRVFLNPCTTRFGYRKVIDVIKEKFVKGDIVDKIGVGRLLYWLRPEDSTQMDVLMDEIIKRSNETDNVVELYHYKLCITSIDKNGNIPSDAEGLIEKIKGNKELEDLLFNKLEWSKK
jgi:hypothetical protein